MYIHSLLGLVDIRHLVIYHHVSVLVTVYYVIWVVYIILGWILCFKLVASHVIVVIYYWCIALLC